VFTVFDDMANSRVVKFIGRAVSFPFRMLGRLFGGRNTAVDEEEKPTTPTPRATDAADSAAE
jgi:hypothetical protein